MVELDTSVEELCDTLQMHSLCMGGSMHACLEPGEAAQQHKHHFLFCLLKPDAFQLPHGSLQDGIDLHDCHGVLNAVRMFLVLQCSTGRCNYSSGFKAKSCCSRSCVHLLDQDLQQVRIAYPDPGSQQLVMFM